MKKLFAILLLSLMSSAYALPNCPYDAVRWHNCFGNYTYADGDKYIGEFKYDKRYGQGTYTYANGAKYVGEFQDDKQHGQGTYTYADGMKDSGYWMNGEFVPVICQDMEVSKGTLGLEQCVLKLIDKI
jgi:hypothetical protein